VVPQGATVQESLNVVNGQIVESFSFKSIDTSVQGQGFTTTLGAISGAASDTIAATWQSQDTFSSVRVNIPLNNVQVGVGDQLMGPEEQAFSSLSFTATLVLPDQSLSFPIFSGLRRGPRCPVRDLPLSLRRLEQLLRAGNRLRA
jgi:hypothetical protein